MNRIVLCLSLVLWFACPVGAQTCLGAPSFDHAPYQGRADVNIDSDTQLLLGTFGAGRTAGLFGNAGAGVRNFSDVGKAAWAVGGSIGSDMRLRGGRMRVCPLVTVTDQFGPNTFSLNRRSLLGVWVGGHFGIVAAETSIAQLIPTMGLSVVHQREGIDLIGMDAGTFSQTFVELDLGAGIVFSDHFSAIPGIVIPINASAVHTAFTFGVAVNFGR
jgi:hypothetical protein